MACCMGMFRQLQNLMKKRKPRYGVNDKSDWQIHIESCLGELCVAKHLNIFWSGKLGILSPGDVGEIEVRHTQGAKNRLIVHKEDLDDSIFILVTGYNGKYAIPGWIYAHEAKDDRFWQDPTGNRRYAYFVPQTQLRSINELRR